MLAGRYTFQCIPPAYEIALVEPVLLVSPCFGGRYSQMRCGIRVKGCKESPIKTADTVIARDYSFPSPWRIIGFLELQSSFSNGEPTKVPTYRE